MNILITGGAGFAGSGIALYLRERYPSYRIVALDNLKRRGSELNLPRLSKAGIEFQHGDIRNREDLHFSNRFDMIIDASAEPSVLAGITSPIEQVVNNNLIGTLNCLELAKSHGAAFIFLSTSRVYPIGALESASFKEEETRFSWTDEQILPGISSKGINEQFTLQGSRSFYGATKLASELLIQEYNALASMKTVINRCGVLTGPWQMGKVDQGVVVLWVARHIYGGQLSYNGYGGTGKQVRDILHIHDLCRLIDWQIHHLEEINGEVFNVGGGQSGSVSLCELTRLCQSVTSREITIHPQAENRVADIRLYITDNSYVTNRTGWAPTISLSVIIQETAQWINSHKNELFSILK